MKYFYKFFTLACQFLDLGCGSVLNEKGDIEMDASIMDGKDLSSGAVSAVRCIENPVKLARLVMEKVCVMEACFPEAVPAGLLG